MEFILNSLATYRLLFALSSDLLKPVINNNLLFDPAQGNSSLDPQECGSSVIPSWPGLRSRRWSLTNPFELCQSSVVISHDFTRQRMILSCDPAILLEIQQLQLSHHSQSFDHLLLPSPGVQHPGHYFTRQMGPFFLSFRTQCDFFFQLRFNGKQNQGCSPHRKKAAESIPESRPVLIPSPQGTGM